MIEWIFNEYMCKQTTKQIEDKNYFTKHFLYPDIVIFIDIEL